MRKATLNNTILTIVGSALIAASTVQMASAAERHHVRKIDRTPVTTSEQFRNANNSMAQPQPFDANNYTEGQILSQGAGR